MKLLLALFTVKKFKGDVCMNKDEILKKAMEAAGNVLGADAAYFGEEGTQEVERQLDRMGYSLKDLREDNE